MPEELKSHFYITKVMTEGTKYLNSGIMLCFHLITVSDHYINDKEKTEKMISFLNKIEMLWRMKWAMRLIN